MNEFEKINIEVDNRGVERMKIKRKEKKNEIYGRMIDEMKKEEMNMEENEEVRIVIMKGEGKRFCEGGEIGWMREKVNEKREKRIEEERKIEIMMKEMREMKKKMIGRIKGKEYGGGVGIISV